MNWPTPATTDHRGARNRTAKRGVDAREINDGLTLTDMVWLGYPLAPPGSAEYKDWERHLDKKVRTRPRVSITFVEWLMGFPSLYWSRPGAVPHRENWLEDSRQLVREFFAMVPVRQDRSRERNRTSSKRVCTDGEEKLNRNPDIDRQS